MVRAIQFTGSYAVNMEKVLPAACDLEELDDEGDRNNVRDQGQVIIESNRITFSNGFGIVADAGARDGAEQCSASRSCSTNSRSQRREPCYRA